jgi:hypothetical protein
MPPHLAQYETNGDPALPITITDLNGGEESAIFVREIWNDREEAFGDTTTAQDMRAVLLAALGSGPYEPSGVSLLDERWARFTVLAYLTPDEETTDGVTGTLPFGTNATIPLPDLPPQYGIRYSLQIVVPGGRTLSATRIGISIDGNAASSPLAQFTSLATGSGVVPADRVTGLRALLRGSEVTADDTDTITLSRGQMVYDGVTTTFLADDVTFNLNDGDGVPLAAGDDYRVTLSRTSAGVLTITKGPKNEGLLYPTKPATDVFVESLTVASADGVAVTVSPTSLVGGARYAQFRVEDGGGLSVAIHPGDGIASTDHRQYLSHRILVALAASSTSRIWILSDGSAVYTLTDAEPEFGAYLLALVTTDTDSVTGITDARTFVHRALTMDRIVLAYRGVFSQLGTAHGLALEYAPFDCEIESVDANLTDIPVEWTGGALIADVKTFAPGAAVPFPAGGAGGVSLFTNSATDDARPTIAYDATSLLASTEDHEVRRLVKNTRILLSIISTITASAPESDQELRVTLRVRRYR